MRVKAQRCGKFRVLSDPILLVEPLANIINIELPEGLHLPNSVMVRKRVRHVRNQVNIIITGLIEQNLLRLRQVVGPH